MKPSSNPISIKKKKRAKINEADPICKTTKVKRARGVAQAVQPLPSKGKALRSTQVLPKITRAKLQLPQPPRVPTSVSFLPTVSRLSPRSAVVALLQGELKQDPVHHKPDLTRGSHVPLSLPLAAVAKLSRLQQGSVLCVQDYLHLWLRGNYTPHGRAGIGLAPTERCAPWVQRGSSQYSQHRAPSSEHVAQLDPCIHLEVSFVFVFHTRHKSWEGRGGIQVGLHKYSMEWKKERVTFGGSSQTHLDSNF
jgi:hypothetical protein